MALTKPTNSPFGIDLDACYIKITKVEITDKAQMRADVSFFANVNSSASSHPLYVKSEADMAYDLDGPNPIKQAYQHLKTLPEFADAIDC